MFEVWKTRLKRCSNVKYPSSIPSHAAPPGRRPGVSGNPSGSKNSTRFKMLYASMLAEFGDAVLTASDRALLEQAARLMARRWRDEEVAVKSTNAARHIVNALHERYGGKNAPVGSQALPWSPLRDKLQRKATDAAKEPAV